MIKIKREEPKKPVKPNKDQEIKELKQEVEGLKLVIDDLILNGGAL